MDKPTRKYRIIQFEHNNLFLAQLFDSGNWHDLSPARPTIEGAKEEIASFEEFVKPKKFKVIEEL